MCPYIACLCVQTKYRSKATAHRVELRPIVKVYVLVVPHPARQCTVRHHVVHALTHMPCDFACLRARQSRFCHEHASQTFQILRSNQRKVNFRSNARVRVQVYLPSPSEMPGIVNPCRRLLARSFGASRNRRATAAENDEAALLRLPNSVLRYCDSAQLKEAVQDACNSSWNVAKLVRP